MNAIVVVDENWAIGKDGDQLVYISADLKRFKELTTGHTVILGRKTLATFPDGRPLKGRRNLILSANPSFSVEGGEVYRDLDSLLEQAEGDAFVIGGEQVYRALLPQCTTVYVTRIGRSFSADRFFPNLDTSPDWTITSVSEPMEEQGIPFRYMTYQRR